MGLFFKDGRAYSRVQVEGKRYQKSHGPVTKTVAQQKHAKFKADLNSGEYQKRLEEKKAEKNRGKLKDFKQDYLDYYERHWRPSSYRRTKFLVANLVEQLGEKYLDSIIPLDVERYKKVRLGAGKKKATVNRELNALSNMFEVAIKFGKARKNPLKGVARFKEDNEKMWVLTPEEEEKLLSACNSIEEKEGGEYLPDLVEVALYSGMRQGEIFNMKREHVSFRHGFIYIPKTKTHQTRKVPMNETLREALKRALRRSKGSEYLFVGKGGEKLKHLKKGFWEAAADAGLIRKSPDGKKERFRFHDLRHTYGSRLGMGGTDLKTIMEIMGHKTTTVAMRYQHPTHEHKKQAVLALDKFRKSTQEAASKVDISDSENQRIMEIREHIP